MVSKPPPNHRENSQRCGSSAAKDAFSPIYFLTEENTKAIRTIYQLLMLTAAVVLVFFLTPNFSKLQPDRAASVARPKFPQTCAWCHAARKNENWYCKVAEYRAIFGGAGANLRLLASLPMKIVSQSREQARWVYTHRQIRSQKGDSGS